MKNKIDAKSGVLSVEVIERAMYNVMNYTSESYLCFILKDTLFYDDIIEYEKNLHKTRPDGLFGIENNDYDIWSE